jgi:hypothetical protein
LRGGNRESPNTENRKNGMKMTEEKEQGLRDEFEANINGEVREWLDSRAAQEQLDAQEEGLREAIDETLRAEFEDAIEDAIDERLAATREDREEKAAEEYEEQLREEFEEHLNELWKEAAA